jgi:hypothetical protein
MGQSPSSEANSRSASQIPRVLCNAKVHYRVDNSPPPFPVLSKMNPFHIRKPNFLKVSFNIIFSSTPMSSEWSLTFRLSDENFVRIFHCPMRAAFPPHLILLYLVTNIWWRVQIVKFTLQSCHFIALTMGPDIPLNTLFSDTLSLCSSLTWEAKFLTIQKQVKL